MPIPLRTMLVAGLAALVPQRGQAQDTLEVEILNRYSAIIEAVIGTATRAGMDTFKGTLVRQADGTWQGVVTARAKFVQTMKAFGFVVCKETEYTGEQRLYLTGTPVGDFNRRLQSITPKTGAADGGFLSLTVTPVAVANMSSMDCLTLREDPRWSFPLLPLNDARWTEPTMRYILGMPQSGVLEYDDLTVLMFEPGEDLSRFPIIANNSWEIKVVRR